MNKIKNMSSNKWTIKMETMIVYFTYECLDDYHEIMTLFWSFIKRFFYFNHFWGEDTCSTN